jgi:hypothetical protein
MTIQQDWATKEFDSELRKLGQHAKIDWEESNIEPSRGSLFGDFRGVTLMVYPEGLISIPSVCSYKAPSPAVAATSAKERFDKQRANDNNKPQNAWERQGGHLGSKIGFDLKCGEKCPCQTELPEKRRKRARGACNTVQWWESHTSWRVVQI